MTLNNFSVSDIVLLLQGLRRLRSKKNNDATKPTQYNQDKAKLAVEHINRLIAQLEQMR